MLQENVSRVYTHNTQYENLVHFLGNFDTFNKNMLKIIRIYNILEYSNNANMLTGFCWLASVLSLILGTSENARQNL